MRGPHSTGVMFVGTTGNTRVVKSLGTPWDLYDKRSFDDAMRPVSNVLMGHNRWATKGKINTNNAHPFEFDGIVGAHNGTLNSCYNLDDNHLFDVDSENLYHHMNKNGVTDTISKANGAYALTWYDVNEKTMNFIRNKERTLFWTSSPDNKTIFWASEDWMLAIALSKCGIEYTEIRDFSTMHHYKFEIEFGYVNNIKPMSKCVVRQLEGYTAPKTYTPPARLAKEKPVVEQKKSHALATYSEHSAYIGKQVEFYIDSAVNKGRADAYLQAYLLGDDTVSVRLFPIEGDARWELMINSPNSFTVVAKQLSIFDGNYLVGDLRTLSEVTLDLDDTPEDTVNVNGREITKKQFIEATKCGCAWCSQTPSLDESDELVWLGSDAFVCGDCRENKDVIDHIASVN